MRPLLWEIAPTPFETQHAHDHPPNVEGRILDFTPLELRRELMHREEMSDLPSETCVLDVAALRDLQERGEETVLVVDVPPMRFFVVRTQRAVIFPVVRWSFGVHEELIRHSVREFNVTREQRVHLRVVDIDAGRPRCLLRRRRRV